MIIAKDIFCLNELGKRTNNEDCISPEKGTATSKDYLFIVCDGVGGEKKGEVASALVCTSIRNYFKNHGSTNGREIDDVQNSINFANQKLAKFVSTHTTAKRMSTTLALVLLGARSIIAAWCGDTRIFHIRDGKVMWKSKDHSLVSELISQGELTEEEARMHPRRNVITRCLNAANINNTPDFHEIYNFETGDYLLLCSDGLLEKIDESIIYTILTDDTEPDKARGFLSYCKGIARDNFSMYLIKGEHKINGAPSRVSKKVVFLFVVLTLLIVAFLLFFSQKRV